MKPPPAEEILTSEISEPILARTRIGEGWALAWMSDVKDRWAVEWPRWRGYARYWTALVREHMRGGGPAARGPEEQGCVEQRASIQVVAVTQGNAFLEAALRADERLVVTFVTPAAYQGGGSADVFVFDRFEPPVPPRAPALYIDPSGPFAPVSPGHELRMPDVDRVDPDHAVTRCLSSFEDVNIVTAHELVPAARDRTIGTATGGVPILVAGVRATRRFVAVGFDIRMSDLPLRAAWPVLVRASLDWLTGVCSAACGGA